MNIEQILRKPQLQSSQNDPIADINEYFVAMIAHFASSQDEQRANSWAVLQMMFKVQCDYSDIFRLFPEQEYYKAWCQLERIEIAIKTILRHYHFVEDEYKILFIKEYVAKLQSLFLYKVFGSSEIVKKEIRCSICDSIVSLRKRCKNQKGEFYMGQICSYIITESELVGFSVVDYPSNIQ